MSDRKPTYAHWGLLASTVLFFTVNCSGLAERSSDNGADEASGGGSATGGDSNMGSGGDGTGGDTTDITIDSPDLPVDTTPIGQIDFLFVIDNSVSMADKQEILTLAVPPMIARIVDPPCLTNEGEAVAAADGVCPDGTTREFAPIEDIHVGVITSSLGGHGSSSCARDSDEGDFDDQGHLIPSVRAGVPSTDPLGFLAWTGGDSTAANQFVADFTNQISAAGESGCGYEAPLEAFYRFLVDPHPPLEIALDDNNRATMTTDAAGIPLVDGTLLSQREAFLRPESLVNVIIFTDENDCSALDGGLYYNNAGFGYLIAQPSFDMPVATSVCETNPNDTCCFSCLQDTPDGCEAYASECGANLTPENDRANVRCFENKRRFGVDLLYPTDRYVKGLLNRQIIDARDAVVVDNPLLTGVGEHVGTVRPHGRVYLTGIVGVPWQDLVTQASLEDEDTFEYLSAVELAEVTDIGGQQANRWDVILGRPGLAMSEKPCQGSDAPAECGQAPVPPLDPFMIESIAERPPGLQNPISGDVIVASTSNDPLANAINGHEAHHTVVNDSRFPDGAPSNDDLQYACIFPLPTPKTDCDPGDASCDCGDEPSRNRPLCQPPGGGPAGTTQYFAKAYPGIRILEVLRDFGENAVVASICPKNLDDGYIPTTTTIIRRMKDRFPVVR